MKLLLTTFLALTLNQSVVLAQTWQEWIKQNPTYPSQEQPPRTIKSTPESNHSTGQPSAAQDSESKAEQIFNQITTGMTFQQVAQIIGFKPYDNYQQLRLDWDWQYPNGLWIDMSVKLKSNQRIGDVSLTWFDPKKSPNEHPSREALKNLLQELRRRKPLFPWMS